MQTFPVGERARSWWASFCCCSGRVSGTPIDISKDLTGIRLGLAQLQVGQHPKELTRA
eukprot:SAG11_NODE_981_length_6316_cov_7.773042_1_plen_58_part_00